MKLYKITPPTVGHPHPVCREVVAEEIGEGYYRLPRSEGQGGGSVHHVTYLNKALHYYPSEAQAWINYIERVEQDIVIAEGKLSALQQAREEAILRTVEIQRKGNR